MVSGRSGALVQARPPLYGGDDHVDEAVYADSLHGGRQGEEHQEPPGTPEPGRASG